MKIAMRALRIAKRRGHAVAWDLIPMLMTLKNKQTGRIVELFDGGRTAVLTEDGFQRVYSDDGRNLSGGGDGYDFDLSASRHRLRACLEQQGVTVEDVFEAMFAPLCDDGESKKDV